MPQEKTNPDICRTLGLLAALISGAGIAIAVFQQINGCSCSEQEQSSPLFKGFV